MAPSRLEVSGAFQLSELPHVGFLRLWYHRDAKVRGFAQLIPSRGGRVYEMVGMFLKLPPQGHLFFSQAAGTRQGKARKCKYFTVHGAAGQTTNFPGVSFLRGMDFVL